MKNLKVYDFKRWIGLCFFAIVLTSLSAQESRSCIYRDGECYWELPFDDRLKFKIEVKHDTLESLIKKVCPNLKKGSYTCNNRLYKNAHLAGFCFMPIWKVKNEGGKKYFNTVGIRVAIALWLSDDEEKYKKIHLAGFKEIEHAFSPIAEKHYKSILDEYTINITTKKQTDYVYSNRIIKATFKKFNKSDKKMLRINGDVREFDFVYLSYERYESLVANKIKNHTSEGITIERSLRSL